MLTPQPIDLKFATHNLRPKMSDLGRTARNTTHHRSLAMNAPIELNPGFAQMWLNLVPFCGVGHIP
jgi:hypothetical protein